MKRYMFNTILVHVARTWERVRISQEGEEMPLDNIESVDAIVEIADEILRDKVIQKLIRCKDHSNWDWDEEAEGFGCSDAYIESLAETLIIREYL